MREIAARSNLHLQDTSSAQKRTRRPSWREEAASAAFPSFPLFGSEYDTRVDLSAKIFIFKTPPLGLPLSTKVPLRSIFLKGRNS